MTATVFTVRTPPLLCDLYWFIYRLAEDLYPMVAVRYFTLLQCQVAQRSRLSIQPPKAWVLALNGRPCKQPSTFLSRCIWFQFDRSWLWYLYNKRLNHSWIFLARGLITWSRSSPACSLHVSVPTHYPATFPMRLQVREQVKDLGLLGHDLIKQCEWQDLCSGPDSYLDYTFPQLLSQDSELLSPSKPDNKIR